MSLSTSGAWAAQLVTRNRIIRKRGRCESRPLYSFSLHRRSVAPQIMGSSLIDGEFICDHYVVVLGSTLRCTQAIQHIREYSSWITLPRCTVTSAAWADRSHRVSALEAEIADHGRKF